MAAANRTVYVNLMDLNLFTIVCDYKGGTYISQVWATDHEHAIIEWSTLLRREQSIESVSDQIAQAADDTRTDNIPITGLSGVWCWTGTVENALALVNIIRSAQP
ncbi:MAG: hypothetical protein J7498_15090 [Sphingobium sp.]|nr:hypothetical protein [Sphingobium sp.]